MTILDADRYRVNYPVIKTLTKEKTEAERIKFISELAIITNVPVIIVATYLAEIYGFTPLIVDFIYRTKRFYNVTAVKNIRKRL